MRNTGTLFANDANADRVTGIVGNLHRLGVTNCVVSVLDGRTLPQVGVLVSSKSSTFMKAYRGWYARAGRGWRPLYAFFIKSTIDVDH